jgi:hypothetical protein
VAGNVPHADAHQSERTHVRKRANEEALVFVEVPRPCEPDHECSVHLGTHDERQRNQCLGIVAVGQVRVTLVTVGLRTDPHRLPERDGVGDRKPWPLSQIASRVDDGW